MLNKIFKEYTLWLPFEILHMQYNNHFVNTTLLSLENFRMTPLSPSGMTFCHHAGGLDVFAMLSCCSDEQRPGKDWFRVNFKASLGIIGIIKFVLNRSTSDVIKCTKFSRSYKRIFWELKYTSCLILWSRITAFFLSTFGIVFFSCTCTRPGWAWQLGQANEQFVLYWFLDQIITPAICPIQKILKFWKNGRDLRLQLIGICVPPLSEGQSSFAITLNPIKCC